MKKMLFYIYILLVVAVEINAEAVRGKVNDNLRLRELPSLNSNTIMVIPNSRYVRIDKRTKFKEAIDEFYDYWLHVRYDNHSGWVYGGYITIENKSKLFLPEYDVIIMNNKLVAASTITSISEFYDRLVAYVSLLTELYFGNDANYKNIKDLKVREYDSILKNNDLGEVEVHYKIITSNSCHIEFIGLNNTSLLPSELEITKNLLPDPWGIGVGQNIIVYKQLFGKGEQSEDKYIFDIDCTLMDLGAVDDLILKTEFGVVKGIEITYFLSID